MRSFQKVGIFEHFLLESLVFFQLSVCLDPMYILPVF